MQCLQKNIANITFCNIEGEVCMYVHAAHNLCIILGVCIRILLTTFLRDVTTTFLSVTDTYIRTHIMRIDPGLESSLRSQIYSINITLSETKSILLIVLKIIYIYMYTVYMARPKKLLKMNKEVGMLLLKKRAI